MIAARIMSAAPRTGLLSSSQGGKVLQATHSMQRECLTSTCAETRTRLCRGALAALQWSMLITDGKP
jgi:hypothetical protein